METNKQKAFEAVQVLTGRNIEIINEEGRFFTNSYDSFFDLFDELTRSEAINLLQEAVSINLEQETKGTVAEVFLRNHENIFITDYGYVFFDSSSC